MRRRRLHAKEIHELQTVISGDGYTREETKRAQAILMLDREKNIAEIREMTGYGRAQTFTLRKRYMEEGIECLKDKREGKPKELLTKKERAEIIETVKTKTPKDLGFVSVHWTTGLLGNWIDRTYKVKYKSKTSLYLIFKKALFTYHKPGHVYRERDEQEVEEWKKSIQPTVNLKTRNHLISQENSKIVQ